MKPLIVDYVQSAGPLAGVRAGQRFAFDIITGVGLLSVGITCTVKDGELPIARVTSLVDGGIAVLSDTSLRVSFGSDLTALWPARTLRYDVQIDLANGESYSIQRGDIKVKRRITRTRSQHYNATAALLENAPAFASARATQDSQLHPSAPLLASALAFGAPAATPGEVSPAAPLHIAPSSAYAPIGADGNLAIAPLHAPAPSFPAVDALSGSITATAPAKTSTPSFAVPSATPGSVAAAAPKDDSAPSFPTLSASPGSVSAAAPLVSSSSTKPAPSGTIGGVTGSPALLASAPSLSVPAVAGSGQVVAPLLSIVPTTPAPTGTPGSVAGFSPFLQSAPTLSAPTGTPGAVNGTAPALASAPSFPAGTATPGSVTASPPLDSSTATFPAPAGSSAASATAPAKTSTPTTPSPTATASITGTASKLSSTATFPAPVGYNGPAFPLVVSASGRYLQDQIGVPFRVQSESAWLMSIFGTSSSVDSYLADRKAKGFNTFILMPIVAPDGQFGGSSNNASGQAPFTSAGHFSTPNSSYWSFIDTIVDKASAKGFLIKFAMVYLGFSGGSQGWANEITQSYNADPVMFNYGVFLATRYGTGRRNILWYTCGDFGPTAGSTLDLRVRKVRDGILSVLPDAIFGAEMVLPDTMPGDTGDVWGSNYNNLDCNTAYGYGPSGRNDQTYDTADRSWGYGKPAWLGEPAYEDTAFGSDTSREGIRAAQWWSITGGMVGGCNMGTKGIWDFGLTASVASRLETDVCHDTVHQNDFWQALKGGNKWQLLVPSGKTQISSRVLASDPTGFNYEHVQACMSSDGSWLVAYAPPNGTGTNTLTFTVDLRGMNAGTMTARWYNPTTGAYTAITGTFNNTLSAKSVTTLGDNGTGQNDWVLVITV